jgi:serine/threonine-protein kinase RsbW
MESNRDMLLECDEKMLISSKPVNNAIIHGNKNNPEKTVTIQYQVSPQKIVFTVKDEGNGFNPEEIPDPTTNENIEKTGGRGIFIIKKLSDHTEIIKPGNTIKIHFNLN